MKRLLFLLLALVILCTSFGCSSSLGENATATFGETGGNASASGEAEGYIDFDPDYPANLTAAQLALLPVASEEMTPDQLRRLAVDYFQLQLSFRWRSNLDVYDYPTTYAKFKNGKSLEKKYIYSGIPYQSTGSGNLYRWLEYYNEETGVMDLERAFAENGGYGDGAAVTKTETDENGKVTYKIYRSFQTMFNQCSVGAFWGWGRVVNSAAFGGTSNATVLNGFIPVGCFTYPEMQTIDQFGEVTEKNPTGYDTKDVVKQVLLDRGDDGMNECYAKMKPGDCLISGGHAMMVKEVRLVYKEDGTLDYRRCSAVAIDQGEGWATDSSLDGEPYRRQGSVDTSYTFAYFQKASYLPWTFIEYQDENDPIDQEHIAFYNSYIKSNYGRIASCFKTFDFSSSEIDEMSGAAVEKASVFTNLEKTGEGVDSASFASLAVGSNYPISDVFVRVLRTDGSVALENVYRALSPRIREVAMTDTEASWTLGEDGEYLDLTHGISDFAGQNCKVEITLRLSTGEELVAATETLK